MDINDVIKKGVKGKMDMKAVEDGHGYGYISFDDPDETHFLLNRIIRAHRLMKMFKPPSKESPARKLPSFIVAHEINKDKLPVIENSAKKRVERIFNQALRQFNINNPLQWDDIKHMIKGWPIDKREKLTEEVLELLNKMHASELEELVESCEILLKKGAPITHVEAFAERELGVTYRQHLADIQMLSSILSKNLTKLTRGLKERYESFISNALIKMREENES